MPLRVEVREKLLVRLLAPDKGQSPDHLKILETFATNEIDILEKVLDSESSTMYTDSPRQGLLIINSVILWLFDVVKAEKNPATTADFLEVLYDLQECQIRLIWKARL